MNKITYDFADNTLNFQTQANQQTEFNLSIKVFNQLQDGFIECRLGKEYEISLPNLPIKNITINNSDQRKNFNSNIYQALLHTLDESQNVDKYFVETKYLKNFEIPMNDLVDMVMNYIMNNESSEWYKDISEKVLSKYNCDLRFALGNLQLLEDFKHRYTKNVEQILNTFPYAIKGSEIGNENYILVQNIKEDYKLNGFINIDNKSIIQNSTTCYLTCEEQTYSEIINSEMYGLNVLTDSVVVNSRVHNSIISYSRISDSVVNKILVDTPSYISNSQMLNTQILSGVKGEQANLIENVKTVDVTFIGKNHIIPENGQKKEIFGTRGEDRTFILDNTVIGVKVEPDAVNEYKQSFNNKFFAKAKELSKAIAISALAFIAVQGNAYANEILSKNEIQVENNNVISAAIDNTKYNVEEYKEYDLNTGDLKLLKHHTNSIKPEIKGYLLADGSPDPANKISAYEIERTSESGKPLKYKLTIDGKTFENLSLNEGIIMGDGKNNLTVNLAKINLDQNVYSNQEIGQKLEQNNKIMTQTVQNEINRYQERTL